ncbi:MULTISPECIES: GntR family transcriptional regulator [Rhizobium/Agrobacterium group]|uniref:GntR family transcriptional regulator n=1 Tax=Rhizobium/Agrobacterium group TaxID=227290 RepID=UPI001571D28D|nr:MULTISPECIES: GntR family transcriptional regulator [Rhizobium/Agrobacterium group]NTA83824.1 GntR family transcriptional regulator [Agrobacterium tumefaciens]NTF96068.1 GntR family transcriptional regulator [Rhizobium rhizogenes]
MSNAPSRLFPSFDAGTPIYEMLRDEIISGSLGPNTRLKVADISERYGVSASPVREALQQLRGEGFVVMETNKGARVRAIDEDFVHNITEIQALIEASLTRWYVGIASDSDVLALEAKQSEIEELNFSDMARHGQLDLEFHDLFYGRHYNIDAIALWRKHREVLRALGKRFPRSMARRAAVMREHRGLIECVRAQDADGAAQIVARHVEGSGQHIIEQMSVARRESSMGRRKLGG